MRVPFLHRFRRPDGDGRIWSAILDRVLRRPLLSVVVAGGLLLALAAPALQLHIADAGHEHASTEPVVGEDLQQAAEGVPG